MLVRNKQSTLFMLQYLCALLYLHNNPEKSIAEARRVLSQFIWVDCDSEIADKSAMYIAQLIKAGKIIEFQDTVIAATFAKLRGNYLVTLNKKHFNNISEIKDKVYTPYMLSEKIGI